MDRKMKHRRGRSLSEALVLDKAEDGGVVISSIDTALSNQNLNEGDKILGATITFDQLSKEQVIKLLKLMEPYDDNIQVLTKNHRSRSLGNLDECAKTPEEMLQDSYSKLYNAKIKKYMRGGGLDVERHSMSGDASVLPTLPRSPKVGLKHDTGLPRLGVDFGLLKSKTVTLEDSQSDVKDILSGSNLNLPPLGTSSTLLPIGKLEARSPKFNGPDSHISGTIPDSSLEHGIDTGLSNTLNVPKVSIEGLNQEYKMPKFKVPDLDLSGPSFNSSELEVNTTDLENPDISFGKLGLKDPKMPDLNGDDFSELSRPSTGFDLQVPDIKGISAPNTNVPKAKMRGQKLQPAYKAPKFTMPKFGLPDVQVPEFSSGGGLDFGVSKPEFNQYSPFPNINGTQLNLGKLNNPEFNLSSPKIEGTGIDIPNTDIRKPKLDLSSPGGKLHLPSGKIKGLSLNKPNFEASNLDINTDLNSPNLNLKSMKGGINFPDLDLPKSKLEGPNMSLKGPKTDLEMPDFDIAGLSEKFKMPKLEGPTLDLSSPDLNLSGPNLGGSINAPNLNKDPKMPKLDLNTSKLNLDIPSGKLKTPDLHGPDWNIRAPSGKLKMPKFNLSGTLGKAKAPKMDVNAPDLDLPNVDFKSPKLDTNTPDINIGSPKSKLKFPKLKLPKFGQPSLKGPEFNGKLDIPDVNTPNVGLKGPKGNLDMNVGSLSGKLRKPNFNFPDFGLSAPKLEGPNLDLKSPDLNLSGDNLSTGMNAPSLSMPKVDLKTPKLDINTADLNLDMPSGKLKTPDLHGPNWDIKAPSGKLKMPKMNMSGTLPKGLNLDYNGDLKSPDWSPKTPKLGGGINAPTLDVSTPEVSIGSPKSKLKLPKLKMPKFGQPGIDGNLDIPDINVNAPKAEFGSLSGKLKKPNLNLSDFNLSAPKFDGPNIDLKAPNFNAPEHNMPKLDLKTPKLDFSPSKLDLDMPSGKLKTPEFHRPNWDVDAPSGKLKMPKFDLSGTLPKGPKMDLNPDLKTPDFSLKAPKLKGGVDVPNMDLPNINLKASKLDMSTPDLNFGSPKAKMRIPKMKMPKANLQGWKGPEMEGPNLDINAPNINLKGPHSGIEMPDVELASTSRKLKLPQFKMPDVGFSSPEFDGPDLDIGTPDLGGKLIKAPNVKLNSDLRSPDFKAPKLGLPNVDIEPKLDINTPKLNVDLPSGKLKAPELRHPEWDGNGPSGKHKMPKIDLSGTLPKVPNMDLNPDINLPELNLKAPKLHSGINAPKLDLPNMDLKGPKLDANNPNVNIGLPDAKFRKPKLDISKGYNVDMEGDLPGPDVSLPNLDLSGAEGKFQMPTLNTPDFRVSRSKVRTPDLNVSGDKLTDAVIPNQPNAELNVPKLDLNVKSPDLDGNIRLPNHSFTGPQVKGSNMDLNVPKPGIHLRAPDLNVDDPLLNFKPSFNNRRSDTIGAKMKTPDLDVDEGIRIQHTERKAPKPKPRTNPPGGDSLRQHIDLSRADLNIDDFTGKNHVLRARGSNAQSGLKLDLVDPKKDNGSPSMRARPSHIKVPDSSDGYYVTVFPKEENTPTSNRKYNTLGGLDFDPGNLDLEVPDQNDQKGSAFFFLQPCIAFKALSFVNLLF
ncbi:neuroblast differentiation-associated protein AHNAK [Gouania willdenowi]|uniref:neuroblast differentiation-associated protein AHNAK n=1 Tax=Gouania willdenowi TaxID=441366 RepID=UPI001055F7C5|nr:neuroblast differentiation-associated protein AHNAK-like [Gouania willdenowi]